MRPLATKTSRGGVTVVAVLASTLAVAALTLFLAVDAANAQATGATFTVDRNDDRALTGPTDGTTCTPAANDCTLRDALANSNTTTGVTDTIDFSVETVTLSAPGIAENQGATGDLDVLDSVTIDGGGGVVIGTNADFEGDRIFDIRSPASATMEFVTVENGGGNAEVDAGGFIVRPGATLTLRDSTVQDNKAVTRGGGIAILGPGQESDLAGGKATLERTSVSGNETTDTTQVGFGGGIYIDPGAELILRDNSTVENNETLITGGGIYLSNPPQDSNLAGGKATVEGSTVSGNKTTFSEGGGGGISVVNGATLALRDSTVSANESASVSGGIASRGDVTIERSIVRDNTATRLAGGIGSGATEGDTVAGNNLTIDSSTISNNTARAAGGLGIISTTATVTNSTISDNTASGTPFDTPASAGGGVAVAGNANTNLLLDHVTVAGNKAPQTAGGGLAIAQGNPATIRARNTIVAENTQGVPNTQCFGTITSVAGSTNLEFPGNSCGFQINADPKLGPLANNGGPTETRALQSGSAAIDAATGCPPPDTDQRGVSRQQDGDNNGTAACDTGAFEADNTPPTVSSIDRASANPTSAASVQFTVTFSESVTGVDTSDFTLTTTGDTSGASVASVTGSGTTYTVTVNTGTGNGTIRLDLTDDDSIQDMARNLLGGTGTGNGNFTSGQTFTIDRSVPPTPTPPAPTEPTDPDEGENTDDCTILGTEGDDVMTGTSEDDVICGLGGNDTIKGKGGKDTILGGEGEDTLQAGKGKDTVYGGDGSDSLSGGKGGDTLIGGSRDSASGGSVSANNEEAATDTIDGGAGKDRCEAGPSGTEKRC